MPPLPPPAPPLPSPRQSWWQRHSAEVVRAFHAYGNWLVGISWTRFVLLSVLLLIASAVLADLAASQRGGDSEEVTITPGVIHVPSVPSGPGVPAVPALPGKKQPAITIEKQDSQGREVTISIDKDGVRIAPRMPAAATSASAAAAPSSRAAAAWASAASAASAMAPSFAASVSDDGVEIRLPPGANSEAVRDAVKEARAAVIDAIHESEQDAADRAKDAADEAKEAAESNAVRTIKRIRAERSKPPLTGLAWLFIVASTILKISYKGTVQAEVKAAEATETAESEQLKRQVVEARMAAMQAQVEPHFLFNTLASHRSPDRDRSEAREPDAEEPDRPAACLDADDARIANPAAHNLGREMAVIRPYLEILKVRMEDRLHDRASTCPRACSRPTSRR